MDNYEKAMYAALIGDLDYVSKYCTSHCVHVSCVHLI